ncbi:MAG: iron ABC transporter permease [Methanothrix sp.]|nr:iron ABC transporter permease [Methanothrix sp.]MCX8207618.1 iron ABC transporter permease [Methanothrix sp.]
MVLSLFIGKFKIEPGDLIQLVIFNLMGAETPRPSVYSTVIFEVRLPRILLAMLVGASLSVSGAAFQGVFRNPLVSPYTLGLSSGAAFGAALSLAVAPQFPVQLSAFFFSLVAVGFAYYIATSHGSTPIVSLLLAGVIVSAVFDSLLSIIQTAVHERALQSIIYWLMGSLATASWSKIHSAFPLALTGCAVIFLLRWRLNVLALGDEEARSVGMNPELYKAVFVVAASLAASSVVSVAGIIGFVGLVVPHMIRMIFGPDHIHMIPLCITFGASFMVFVDDLARASFGFEVPVGVITTLTGAPFFVYLLRSTRSGGWE